MVTFTQFFHVIWERIQLITFTDVEEKWMWKKHGTMQQTVFEVFFVFFL